MKYSLFAGVAAALSSLVSAQVQLSGNAVYSPDINTPATAGAPTQIKFDGTGLKSVSLILLKGPSTNVVPIDTIATGIAVTDGDNYYTWTPSTSLENLPTEGYGIKLVDDATGNFQYSTQFGIKNDAPATPDKPSEEPPSVEPSAEKPTYGGEPAVTASAKPYSAEPAVIYSTEYETITSCDCSETPVPTGTGIPVPPTYVPGNPPSWNSTTPEVPAVPTGTGVPPYYTSGTSSAVPSQYTGAADRIQVSGSLIAAFFGILAIF